MGKNEITALPLSEADRRKSVETANVVFEAVLERLDLENPDAVEDFGTPKSALIMRSFTRICCQSVSTTLVAKLTI